MEQVSGWLFQRSVNKQVGGVTQGIEDMATSVQNSFSNYWNQAVGTTQVPLVDVLSEFELPKGIFPKNVAKYTLEKIEGSDELEGNLMVTMPYICEVRFSDGHEIRYNKVITAVIKKGKLEAIEGMKSHGFTWSELQDIVVHTISDKIDFMCSTRKKSKLASGYKSPRVGVEADKF